MTIIFYFKYLQYQLALCFVGLLLNFPIHAAHVEKPKYHKERELTPRERDLTQELYSAMTTKNLTVIGKIARENKWILSNQVILQEAGHSHVTTPLFLAIAKQEIDIVKALLSNHVDFARTYTNRTYDGQPLIPDCALTYAMRKAVSEKKTICYDIVTEIIAAYLFSPEAATVLIFSNVSKQPVSLVQFAVENQDTKLLELLVKFKNIIEKLNIFGSKKPDDKDVTRNIDPTSFPPIDDFCTTPRSLGEPSPRSGAGSNSDLMHFSPLRDRTLAGGASGATPSPRSPRAVTRFETKHPVQMIDQSTQTPPLIPDPALITTVVCLAHEIGTLQQNTRAGHHGITTNSSSFA